ncbi:MAG: SDR family NAD(P)-dependent oxidoreductase, partial [Exilibacterium sp.]
PDDQPVVYSKGSITIESESTAAPKIDLRQTISTCNKDIITAQQCYKIFEDMGMEYGAGHKGIKEILVGRNSVVAKLDLNESDIYEQSKYCLHPGLFDSALQTGVGMLSLQSLSKTLVLPFALESIRVFTKIKNRTWVIVSYSAGSNSDSKLQKLDIDLCDESGVVCVRLKGLSLRKVLPNPKRESFDIVLAEPQWNVSETILRHIDNYSSHIIFFCEVNDSLKDKIEIQLPNSEVIWFTSLSDTIEQRYEDYSVGIFTKIQSLFKKIHLGRVFFQVIIFAEGDRSILSGLVSLLQTANLENSSFIGQLIEVDTEDANDAEHVNTIVLDNARMPEDKLIRHINGKRLVSGWRRFATACHSSDCVFRKCWKNNATYLITGGMGGLGYIFANEITRQIQDVNLILTGRSEIDATIQNKIDYLLSNGANAIYIATDVADKVAVEAMVQKIQTEFGELNGIIHSSGIIEDNLILNKDIAEFKRVLSPKIQGVVNLDQCTRSIALDFFVLFSSVAGCIGNVGQVDYVAANAFLNGFSRYRNSLVERGQRSGRTLSINWPLWKDGGMRVSRETEDMIFRSTGMCAMNSTDGIEAFYAAIESNMEWVMVLYGNAKKIENKIISVSSKTVTDRKEKSIGNVTGVLDREKESKTNSVPALKFKKILEVKLVDIVEKILKIESEFIDFNKEFSSFGFDSIGLTEFSNRINEEFGIELTPMVFYEYPTIGKFIDFLSLEHKDKCSELQLNEADIDLHVIDSEELTSSSPPENFLNISQISKPEVTPLSAIQALSSDNLESQQTHDSIAVIGISGCFPMAEDIDDFWNVLVEGVDCISEIPSTRWDWREIYGDPHTEVNKCNIKWGGFINKVDVFDPLFFGISPKEALLMDPQQRLLMTHVWKVIEDAGHSPESLAGTRTGIFVGTTSTEYGDLILQSGIAIEGYSASGSVASIGPNRMSYLLDLHGPSEPIETACSSSLVAIHRAVEAMKSGGCMLSIVGGVNTIVTPRLHISFNKAGMLSQDGRCKTFSDQANGYVRGEGVGLIFLKWLSDAEKDGDHIYGLIKGSAENHGGRANSLTAPNQGAQARVIQEAHRAAGVEASSISYIEAHGTGTELGDPIEIEGLKKVFQSSSSENSVSENNEGSLLKHSCGLGSVKSNIGHLELAAGIAGVIKVLLQLKHKTLVKSLHCETINPYINLSNSPLYIVDENRYWMPQKDVQGRDLPRRAGVSSFGFGGVNAHVVIEEYIESTICDRESNSLIGNSLNSPIDSPIHNSAESSKNKQHIIVLSAKNQERLKAQVNNILVFINNNNKNDIDTNLQNLAYTLQVGRVCMESKLAVIVENSQEKIKCQSFEAGAK